jgi:O-antigen ligase
LHNDYAAFLFERGPLGAIGWVWIVGAVVLAPVRAAYQSPDRYRRWRLLALGVGFLSCAVNAFAHEISHFRQVWVLMAFVFATVYAYRVRSATASAINAGSANKV